jgi:hypothetical protein
VFAGDVRPEEQHVILAVLTFGAPPCIFKLYQALDRCLAGSHTRAGATSLTAAIFVVTPRRGGAVDGAARAVFELKTCSPPTRAKTVYYDASEDYTF